MCLKETYSKVPKRKCVFDAFPIQKCLKQWDALLPLVFNIAIECGTRKVQVDQAVNKYHKEKHRSSVRG
jgi:hypothetical protein